MLPKSPASRDTVTPHCSVKRDTCAQPGSDAGTYALNSSSMKGTLTGAYWRMGMLNKGGAGWDSISAICSRRLEGGCPSLGCPALLKG